MSIHSRSPPGSERASLSDPLHAVADALATSTPAVPAQRQEGLQLRGSLPVRSSVERQTQRRDPSPWHLRPASMAS